MGASLRVGTSAKEKTALALPPCSNHGLLYLFKRGGPPAFLIHFNSEVKRLNSWGVCSAIGGPFSHPTPPHGTKALSQVEQAKNTGASTALFSAHLWGTVHTWRGRKRNRRRTRGCCWLRTRKSGSDSLPRTRSHPRQESSEALTKD